MLETNSTNKCNECGYCFYPEVGHQPYCHLTTSCPCHHPVTQSKEWGERFDEIRYEIEDFFDYGERRGDLYKITDYKKLAENVEKKFVKLLRTELESLLQEIGYITAKPIGAGRPLTKENQAYNLALSTMREVISKRIQQYGGQ